MVGIENHRSLEKQEKEMMEYLLEFFKFYFKKLLEIQDEEVLQTIKTLRENKDDNSFRKNLKELLGTVISGKIIIEFLKIGFSETETDFEYIGDLTAEINRYLEEGGFLKEVKSIFNNYFSFNNPVNENFR